MDRRDDSRPWLQHYPPDMPADLPLPTRSLLDIFQQTARSQPGAPALYYFDTVLSFGALDAYASSLAAALHAGGLQPGDRVALSLQNVPAFAIAVYAAWKCGAIVVPLNPMLRHAEVLHHLRDAGVRVLISLDSLLPVTLPAAQAAGVERVIRAGDHDFRPALPNEADGAYPAVERLLDLCARFRDRPAPLAPLAPTDTAYLVYTSGTTGPPKGAIITHGNVVYSASVYATWMRLGSGDVVLGGAPLFHITGLIAHLAVGGYVGIPVILAYRFDAGEILRLQTRWRGTFTVMAITAFIALLNHPDIEHYDLHTLTKGYSGGAPIPPSVVETFRARTGVTIYPVYGLTETTSPSHAAPLGVPSPVDPLFGTIAIGLPLPGVHSRIVGAETRLPVPVGEAGEIVISGPMVVPGYWQQPEESRAAIPDGLLHTGDIGSMDSEGWFYLVDRKKDMIIASGFKIWPREVEDVLFQHQAVREAVVVGVPDAYRGETVKAVVSLRPGASVAAEELIAFCRERLAAYKVPRLVEIIDEIPKTATGKLARRLLRAESSAAETTIS